jgi:hypothetical protein
LAVGLARLGKSRREIQRELSVSLDLDRYARRVNRMARQMKRAGVSAEEIRKALSDEAERWVPIPELLRDYGDPAHPWPRTAKRYVDAGERYLATLPGPFLKKFEQDLRTRRRIDRIVRAQATALVVFLIAVTRDPRLGNIATLIATSQAIWRLLPPNNHHRATDDRRVKRSASRRV